MENQHQNPPIVPLGSSRSPSKSRLFSPAEADRILAVMAAEQRVKQAQNLRGRPSRMTLTIPAGATPEAIEAERQRKARADAIQLRTRVDEFRRECRVPAHYAAASLADTAAVPRDCRARYAEVCATLESLLAFPAIVALIGPRGPGKTHMACGLVNAFVAAGRPAQYFTVADMIRGYRSTWGTGAGADEKFIQRLVAQHLLVIDEVQERKGTDDEDLIFTRVVDKRYAANRATVLIANLTDDAFCAHVGTSIADRLNDGGGVLTCDWPSLRGRLVEQRGSAGESTGGAS